MSGDFIRRPYQLVIHRLVTWNWRETRPRDWVGAVFFPPSVHAHANCSLRARWRWINSSSLEIIRSSPAGGTWRFQLCLKRFQKSQIGSGCFASVRKLKSERVRRSIYFFPFQRGVSLWERGGGEGRHCWNASRGERRDGSDVWVIRQIRMSASVCLWHWCIPSSVQTGKPSAAAAAAQFLPAEHRAAPAVFQKPLPCAQRINRFNCSVIQGQVFIWRSIKPPPAEVRNCVLQLLLLVHSTESD